MSGNSQETKILELAGKIKELTKSKSDMTFHTLPRDDPKRRCPDTPKLEKMTGWKTKIDFENGLKRTIRWLSPRRTAGSPR
jgi:nucleoside-diphosphate-sugar epimerase